MPGGQIKSLVPSCLDMVALMGFKGQDWLRRPIWSPVFCSQEVLEKERSLKLMLDLNSTGGKL